MKIGIRLHDLAKDTPENAFKKAKDAGFDYIQLVFKKALKDENGNFLVFNEENAKKVATFLNKYDLKVAMLGAYFNPVHSNKELVQKNKEYFVEHLKYASIVGENYFPNWEKIFLQLGKNMVPASRSIIGRRDMTRNTRRKFF